MPGSAYLAPLVRVGARFENRNADPTAWARLQAELDTELPLDHKTIVDAYAPITINAHLQLSTRPLLVGISRS